MSKKYLFSLAACLLLFPAFADAGVRIGIGLGIGIPIGGYYPYGYGYGYPYYGPAYYPAPVVVQQPQYVMPPAVAYPQTAPVAPMAAPPSTTVGNPPQYNPAPPVVSASSPASGVSQSSYDQAGSDVLIQRLSQGDENVRRDAAMDLGRMKADRAVDVLCSLLARDSSPVVRDAAARALGLIGSTRALNPLIRAAQADNDRDVRHSAQFAVEVIRSQLRR